MKEEYKDQMRHIPAHARLWIYMADRSFTENECAEIRNALKTFTASWAAHGKELRSYGELLYDRFLVLAVAEDVYAASGCSIDSSVKFIREIAARYQVDFFNRRLVAYVTADGSIQSCDFSQLTQLQNDGTIQDDTIIFNNLVETKEAFEKEWQQPYLSSRYNRLGTVGSVRG